MIPLVGGIDLSPLALLGVAADRRHRAGIDPARRAALTLTPRGWRQSTASAGWRCSMASVLATVLRSSRRSQMKSTAPLVCRNSALKALRQRHAHGGFDHARAGKADQRLGSAITTSPMNAKPALTPPMVGSVSTLM